jgi:hypothetical protein
MSRARNYALDQQILAMRRDGYTNRQIEEELGLRYSSVAQRFHRLRGEGFDVPPAPYWDRGQDPERRDRYWGKARHVPPIQLRAPEPTPLPKVPYKQLHCKGCNAPMIRPTVEMLCGFCLEERELAVAAA